MGTTKTLWLEIHGNSCHQMAFLAFRFYKIRFWLGLWRCASKTHWEAYAAHQASSAGDGMGYLPILCLSTTRPRLHSSKKLLLCQLSKEKFQFTHGTDVDDVPPNYRKWKVYGHNFSHSRTADLYPHSRKRGTTTGFACTLYNIKKDVADVPYLVFHILCPNYLHYLATMLTFSCTA